MAAAVASNRNPADRSAEATVHIAQLDEKVTDALLWELMVQVGPVRHVYIPRNRITGAHFGYGFCEFNTPLDALYATKVLNMVKLFSKSIRISQSTVDKVSQDVGANLFVGNLVAEVDEKLLHDAFSAFGPLVDAPSIVRDLPKADSRRYGFVKYSRFEDADAAIASMNGQYICNHPITVQYAFKKDSTARERHGSQAERTLAARALQNSTNDRLGNRLRQNIFFAESPPPKSSQPEPSAIAGHQQPISVPPMPEAMPGAIPATMPATQPPYGYLLQGAHPVPHYPAHPYTVQGQAHPVAGWHHSTLPATDQQGIPIPPYPPTGVTPPLAYQGPPQAATETVQIGWSQGRHPVRHELALGATYAPIQHLPVPPGNHSAADEGDPAPSKST